MKKSITILLIMLTGFSNSQKIIPFFNSKPSNNESTENSLIENIRKVPIETIIDDDLLQSESKRAIEEKKLKESKESNKIKEKKELKESNKLKESKETKKSKENDTNENKKESKKHIDKKN